MVSTLPADRPGQADLRRRRGADPACEPGQRGGGAAPRRAVAPRVPDEERPGARCVAVAHGSRGLDVQLELTGPHVPQIGPGASARKSSRHRTRGYHPPRGPSDHAKERGAGVDRGLPRARAARRDRGARARGRARGSDPLQAEPRDDRGDRRADRRDPRRVSERSRSARVDRSGRWARGAPRRSRGEAPADAGARRARPAT